jgi:hypothetical protein
VRQGLLDFSGEPDPGAIRFSRRDNGMAMTVALDLSHMPPSPQMHGLMAAAMQPHATTAQRAAFGTAWQERVRRLLLEHADDPAVLRVTRLD